MQLHTLYKAASGAERTMKDYSTLHVGLYGAWILLRVSLYRSLMLVKTVSVCYLYWMQNEEVYLLQSLFCDVVIDRGTGGMRNLFIVPASLINIRRQGDISGGC